MPTLHSPPKSHDLIKAKTGINDYVIEFTKDVNTGSHLPTHGWYYVVLRTISSFFSETWKSTPILSRASAAALSTVLRTTSLSYGKIRFSGICPAETPQLIAMKLCTNDYVGEVSDVTNKCWNRWTGGGPTDRWNITSETFLTIPYPTLLYFTLPLFFL
jgi:hypothetical protein